MRAPFLVLAAHLLAFALRQQELLEPTAYLVLRVAVLVRLVVVVPAVGQALVRLWLAPPGRWLQVVFARLGAYGLLVLASPVVLRVARVWLVGDVRHQRAVVVPLAPWLLAVVLPFSIVGQVACGGKPRSSPSRKSAERKRKRKRN